MDKLLVSKLCVWTCVCVVVFVHWQLHSGRRGAGRRKKCADPKQKNEHFFYTNLIEFTETKVNTKSVTLSMQNLESELWHVCGCRHLLSKKWQIVIRDRRPIVAYAALSVPNQNLTMFWNSGVLDARARRCSQVAKCALCNMNHSRLLAELFFCMRFFHRLC